MEGRREKRVLRQPRGGGGSEGLMAPEDDVSRGAKRHQQGAATHAEDAKRLKSS